MPLEIQSHLGAGAGVQHHTHPSTSQPRAQGTRKSTGAVETLSHIELYFNPVRKVQELHQKILQSLLPTDKKYTTKL